MSPAARTARLLDRLVTLTGLGLCVRLVPELAARLEAEQAGVGPWVLGAGGLIALALLPALRSRHGGGTLAALVAATQRSPGVAIMLLASLGLLGLAALVVLREWGVLLLLAVGAAAWLHLSRAAPEARVERATRLLQRTALASGLLVAGLVAGELVLRAHPQRVGGGGGGNPALGVLHDGLYTYNALGLRGPLPRDGADRRILALGDSFTFGQGVGEAHTWPAQLAARLRSAAPGRSHAVINAGRPGLDLVGEHAWLVEHGDALDPDVLVVQFYMNDVIVHRPVGVESERAGYADPLSSARRASWLLFHLSERAEALLAGRAGEPDWAEVFARNVRRRNAAWYSCAGAIDDLAAWSASRDTPILLLLYPHPGRPRTATATIHAAVAAHARAAGLAVLDLAPLVVDVPPARQIAAPYDHHPSPELHGIAARAVHERLEALGWLE